MNPLFPINIYINRKNSIKQLYMYSGLLAVCIISFWYASGKFFTENYYYLKASLLLPFCIVAMIIGVFAQIKNVNRKEPIITLDKEGIQYFWMKLPLVKWNEIKSVEECFFNNQKQLAIRVKNINAYTERIMNQRLKEKYIKRFNKTGSDIAFYIEVNQLKFNQAEFEELVRKMSEE